MIHIFQKPGADLIHDQQSQTFFFEFMYLRWLSSNVKKRLPGVPTVAATAIAISWSEIDPAIISVDSDVIGWKVLPTMTSSV